MTGVAILTLSFMKLNFIRLAMGILIAATMTACGGGPSGLKPESTSVKGKLGDCFTVVDREYKLKEGNYEVNLTIEIERTDAALPFTYKPNSVCYYGGDREKNGVGMGLELLDKDGDIIYKTDLTDYFEMNNKLASKESVIELIKLAPNETGSVEFKLPKEEIKGAVSFRVVTAFEAAEEEEEPTVSYSYSSSTSDDDIAVVKSDDSDSYTSSSSSKGSQDWDDLLDSYERFANKYIAFLKKVKAGTASITSPEYAEYSTEALNFAEKMSKAESDMTSEQILRLNSISAKIAASM